MKPTRIQRTCAARQKPPARCFESSFRVQPVPRASATCSISPRFWLRVDRGGAAGGGVSRCCSFLLQENDGQTDLFLHPGYNKHLQIRCCCLPQRSDLVLSVGPNLFSCLSNLLSLVLNTQRLRALPESASVALIYSFSSRRGRPALSYLALKPTDGSVGRRRCCVGWF